MIKFFIYFIDCKCRKQAGVYPCFLFFQFFSLFPLNIPFPFIMLFFYNVDNYILQVAISFF